MKLVRLEFSQHPKPPAQPAPERCLRLGDGHVGYVANVYVDDEGNYRFVDVATGRVMGWLGTNHRRLPVEAIAEGETGSTTLKVDRQAIESAPSLGDPHAAPDEGLKRAAREHYGYSVREG
jgi:hypothetical protein